ncbi:Zn(2)-C6 fungal-type DNA-binding domain protein [Cordyceps fumosorosea ARSEF 2679]|uniref:Zn(2)-C6 fungal-type DNA-binding domain protein n=1 Tax=Cordyceps fumosorosea (strain ARSEF 2679) TaxID=1081104 RepID=A0A167RSE2_CORFA|nr:Zn(2)-C6 fungal-type DNA-binding domain protein [Cordyceps fumosorosea ARSEF 2679]OAA58892.1 Zn(2)-C6 fungal-type DNA-binding domain protein [Cordyceps fumosorosea ARSEF 2679]
MAPTPPSADAASSASPNGGEDRTRRNVACVKCRNSKVRCRTSTVPGQPCQRCAKLQISCVVDKFHKRITKRSKLEQLEEELQSIKQVVHPHGADTKWTPTSPRSTFPNALENNNRSFAQPIPQAPTPLSEPSAAAAAPPSARLPEQRPKTGPTEARMLGEHVVSGHDVDWYFNKFLQCFHPALPILRKRDPDECYEASPTLFWVVIYVTCRRYTTDRVFFRALVDYVEKDISKALMEPAMTLETAHAALFLCAWPLPVIRLLTDTSTTYISIVMTGIMMIGAHTGRGSHKQFCIGSRKARVFSDEEAASTWVACCALAQKISAMSGHPPPSIQHDDTQCRASLDSPFWADLLSMFDVYKFLNRFHAAMSVHASSHGHASSSEVARWEQEFEALKPAIIQSNSDLTHVLSLSALLEIQTFYFSANPEAPPHVQRINYLRAFSTARRLIATALEHEARGKLLTHATNQVFRSLVDAACIVTGVLYSTSAPPDVSPRDADLLAQHAAAVLHRCSVEESDLPHRIGVIVETFWAVRHLVPRIEVGPRAWSDRLGVGVSFWCLELFKRALRAAQKNSETAAAANRADELIHRHRRTRQQTAAEPPATDAGVLTAPTGLQGAPTSVGPPINMLHPMAMGADPFQEIDWSMFTDDFGWIGDDGVLLGLP